MYLLGILVDFVNIRTNVEKYWLTKFVYVSFQYDEDVIKLLMKISQCC